MATLIEQFLYKSALQPRMCNPVFSHKKKKKNVSAPGQGQKHVVLALWHPRHARWSAEAVELGKWAVLGQIDANHTASQLAL